MILENLALACLVAFKRHLKRHLALCHATTPWNLKSDVVRRKSSLGLGFIRMREQQQPSSGVKASVVYLCSLLESLGVVGLTPELLRQAKFNCPSAASRFWRPLHDLVCLQLCCFPDSKHDGGRGWVEQDVLAPSAMFQELWRKDCSVNEDCLSFVKFYMALWEYPPHSPFFNLSADTGESRQLLLAFAWLVSHCHVFLRGLELRTKPLILAMEVAPTPPYPPDVSFSAVASARAQQVQLGVEEHVAKMLRASNKVKDGDSRAQLQARQLLLLYGRIGVILKSLHSLQRCKYRRIHQLNEAQIAACSQRIQSRHHTQYELQLLQDEDLFQKHFAALQAEKALTEEMSNCQRHEENFWNWMESVLDADAKHKLGMMQNASGSDEDASSNSGVSQETLIPVIRFLKKMAEATAESTYHEACCQVAQVPDDILTVLAPAFTAKSNSSRKLTNDSTGCVISALVRESRYMYQPSPRKDTGNAKEKIERLAEAFDKLEAGCAELRDQHRIVVEKLLKPYVEDESCVVAGM